MRLDNLQFSLLITRMEMHDTALSVSRDLPLNYWPYTEFRHLMWQVSIYILFSNEANRFMVENQNMRFYMGNRS